MNCAAFLYPKDGNGFICPYSCKEMKDAGVSLNLAINVIPSSEQDVDVNFDLGYTIPPTFTCNRILIRGATVTKELCDEFPNHIVDILDKAIVFTSNNNTPLTYDRFIKLKHILKGLACYVNPDLSLCWSQHTEMSMYDGVLISHYELVTFLNCEYSTIGINNKLTSIKTKLTFDVYLKLKKHIRHCHIRQYKRHIHIIQCDNLLLKYHPLYDIYVSPYEFNVLFPQQLAFSSANLDMYFSTLYGELSPYAKHTSNII